MAKPGKKKKVLFVLEIIVLLLFIGGLYVYGQLKFCTCVIIEN